MIFDKFLVGSRLIGKIGSIRFVTENVAIMIAAGGMSKVTAHRSMDDLIRDLKMRI